MSELIPHEQPTVDELLENLNEVKTKLDNDVERAEDIQRHYSQQHNAFRETADNDDGNEEHLGTFNPDADDVRGSDRAEELTRIGDFLEEVVPNYHNRINQAIKQVEDAKTPEQLYKAQDAVDEIVEGYKNACGVVDDV